MDFCTTSVVDPGVAFSFTSAFWDPPVSKGWSLSPSQGGRAFPSRPGNYLFPRAVEGECRFRFPSFLSISLDFSAR